MFNCREYRFDGVRVIIEYRKDYSHLQEVILWHSDQRTKLINLYMMTA